MRVKVPKSLKKVLYVKSLLIPAPTAEILPIQKKLLPLLRRAWPEATEKDVSWLSADLAALWEVSRVHAILIRKMLKMGSRPNKSQLQEIAQELDVNWFSNASGHMKTMKGELSRFKASLYRPGRTRSPKSWETGLPKCGKLPDQPL